jgi:DNA-binding HxlR family transcriptional regulator
MDETTASYLDETEGSYCEGRSCAAEIARALQAVSGRWSVRVIETLHFAGGPLRFSDLKRQMVGVSPKELTRNLALLVRARIVRRLPAPAYELTDHGRALLPMIEALGEWAQRAEGPRAGQPANWLSPLTGGR